jgi:hypothetical protein
MQNRNIMDSIYLQYAKTKYNIFIILTVWPCGLDVVRDYRDSEDSRAQPGGPEKDADDYNEDEVYNLETRTTMRRTRARGL